MTKNLGLSELKQSYSLMQRSLKECTGLSEFNRGLVTCWTLGTHALPDPDTKIYPALALRGKLATGKSATMDVVENFGRLPKKICLAGSTVATVRDLFAECRERVAILEEADSAMHDRDGTAEQLFNARYSRSTESFNLKMQISESNTNHATQERLLFGATVLHKRESFIDPVMEGKSIAIQFRPNTDRNYLKFDRTDSWNREGHKLVQGVTLTLPKVSQPARVASRLFDTYRPVLAVAQLIEDCKLEEYIVETMREETKRLMRAQGEEPDVAVLNSILERVFREVEISESGALVGDPEWKFITAQELCIALRQRQESERKWSSYQISNYARDMGFRVEPHRGQQRIYPSEFALLRACEHCSLTTDVLFNAFREKVEGKNHADNKEKKEDPPLHTQEQIFTPRLPETKDLAKVKGTVQ